MHFIKQIFLDQVEEWVHQRFIRYGKGEFGGPVIDVKVAGDSVKVRGSVDYVTSLGNIIAEGSEIIELEGIITAKREIESVINETLDVKKSSIKKGLHTVEVSGSLESNALCELYEKLPDAYILLDMSAGKQKLKSKKKVPKPGSKIDDGFCSATINIKMLGTLKEELLFDVDDFKEVSVSHRYVITEIVPPEGVKDPAQVRVLAKRGGKILRKVVVDGSEKTSDHELLV